MLEKITDLYERSVKREELSAFESSLLTMVLLRRIEGASPGSLAIHGLEVPIYEYCEWCTRPLVSGQEDQVWIISWHWPGEWFEHQWGLVVPGAEKAQKTNLRIACLAFLKATIEDEDARQKALELVFRKGSVDFGRIPTGSVCVVKKHQPLWSNSYYTLAGVVIPSKSR